MHNCLRTVVPFELKQRAKEDLQTLSDMEDMDMAKHSKKTHEHRGPDEHQREWKSSRHHRQTFAHLIHDAILRLNCAPFPSRHHGSSKWAIARDLEKHYGMRLGKKFDAKLKVSLAKLVRQGKLIPIGNRHIKYVLSPKFAAGHSHRQRVTHGHTNSHSAMETSKAYWSPSYDTSGRSSPHHRSRSQHHGSRSRHHRSSSQHHRSQSRNPRSGSPHKGSEPSSGSRRGSGSGFGSESVRDTTRDSDRDEGGSKSKSTGSKAKGSKSKSLTRSWFGFGGAGSESECTSGGEDGSPTERDNNNEDAGSGGSSPQKKSGSGNFTGWLWPAASTSKEGKIDQTSQKHTGFGGVFGRFQRGRSPEKTSNRNGSRQSSRGKSAERQNLSSPRVQSYVASPKSPSLGLRGGLGRVFNRFKRGRSREKTVSRSRRRQTSRGRSAEVQNLATSRLESSGLRGGLGRVLNRFNRGQSREKTVSRSRSRQNSRGRSAEARNLASPKSQSSGRRRGLERGSKRLKRGERYRRNSRGRSAEFRNLACPRSRSLGFRELLGRGSKGFKRGRPCRSQACSACGDRSAERSNVASPTSPRVGLRRRGLRSALKRRKIGQSLETAVSSSQGHQRRGGRSTGCQHVAGGGGPSLGPPLSCDAVRSFPNHRRSVTRVKCPPALAKLQARPRLAKGAILKNDSYSSAPPRSRSKPRITKVATLVDNPENLVEDSERGREEMQVAIDNDKDAHGRTSSPKTNSRQSGKRQELPASSSGTSESGRFLNAPLASRLKNLQRE